MTDREKTIEDLYRVFARYPRPKKVEGSPVTRPDVQYQRRMQGPLRDIRDGVVHWYVMKVFLTLGGIEDFKHFLPRILELVAEPYPLIDPWLAFGKLMYGEWDAWRASERQAVEAYLDAGFEAAIQWDNSREPDPYDMESSVAEWLEGLVRCVEDVSPFLARLMLEGNSQARSQFLAYYRHSARSQTDTKGAPFHQRATKNQLVIDQWMQSQG